MGNLFKKIFGLTPWKPEWQEELTRALHEAQKGLAVNMVVIIARESDIYAEILFIFGFLGLGIGSLLAWALESTVKNVDDLLILPLAGFAVGATLYTFRRFYITKLAPRAVRERVAQKAKSQFFDHHQHLKSRLALIYFSELEREALFCASPEIMQELPANDIKDALTGLLKSYNAKDPLVALKPCLQSLGNSIRRTLKANTDDASAMPRTPNPVFIGASDRPAPKLQIPLLKGNKDVN